MAQLRATPWSVREKPVTRSRFAEPVAASGETTETAAPALPRRLRINQSDLERHEYTDGCPQCIHIQKYGKARAGGQHSNRCRERLEKAIGDSEAGKARMEAHEERVTRSTADRIEHDDEKSRGDVSQDAGRAPAAAPPTRVDNGDGPRDVLGEPLALNRYVVASR